MKTFRSFCKECKREWIVPTTSYVNSAPVSISGNPLSGSNCPICGSPEITDIYFDPDYPGLDIPRDASGNPIPMGFSKPKSLETIPGLSNVNPLIIKSEPGILLRNNPIIEFVGPEIWDTKEEEPPSDYYKIDYGE